MPARWSLIALTRIPFQVPFHLVSGILPEARLPVSCLMQVPGYNVRVEDSTVAGRKSEAKFYNWLGAAGVALRQLNHCRRARAAR